MGSKKKLLDFLNSQKRSISKEKAFLECGFKSKQKFKNAMNELKSEALLVENGKGKIVSPKVCGFVKAKIVSYCGNFLFAQPFDSVGDIYIPIEKSSGALVDDIVLINRIKNSEKGLSGAVERVVSKGNRLFTGLIKREKKQIFFIPDSGYKRSLQVVKSNTKGAKENDKVQVKIFLKAGKPSAKVVKVYGKATCAKICADAIIDEKGIATVFSDKAILDAENAAKKGIKKKDILNRVDLRGDLIFTIDGEDAKDLDDAISVAKTENGFCLGVHIADVSHYIKFNSNLDMEARERGTSVYFADRVIPMLPTKISNGICSLNQGEDRLAFSVFINLDVAGNVLNYELKKSVINSKVRGVYSEINKILEGAASKKLQAKYKDVLNALKTAKELSDLLEKNAQKRGKLDLESVESKFTLDENGICVGVEARERGQSEKIIENFMVLANECTANFAIKNNLPFIYRVHEEPDPEKILNLSKFLTLLNLKLPKSAITSPKPKHFVALLNKAKNTEIYEFLSDKVLRSMSKARYFEKPLGHFGLSLSDYCHFTSPIRRYPDTTVHRILSDFLAGKSEKEISKKYGKLVVNVSESASLAEVVATGAERDAEKYYMAEYLSKHMGETFSSQISGMIQKGVFVRLENTVEGFVDLEQMGKHKYIFDGLLSYKDASTGEKLTLGDKVKVKVDYVNVAEGIIDFTLENN